MSQPSLPPIATVTGDVDESALELREVFSRAVARSQGGAQFTLIVGDKVVLDLAGGSIQTNTPVQVFSVSKAVVATAAALAQARGLIDLDQPVASYWKAMGKPTTKAITPRMILDHSSGISGVSQPMTTDDWLSGALDRLVETQEPFWQPGTDHGYHTFTFGALMNGVFVNALGMSVAEFVATNITEPLGCDFWFGAPAGVLSSVAALSFEFPVITAGTFDAIAGGKAIYDGSFEPIMAGAPFFFGDPRVISANWPALTGMSSASDLAGLFAGAYGIGSRPGLLDSSAIDALRAERHHGPDRTLHHVSRFGSGVELPHVYSPMLGGGSFGHQGAGGSIVVADPDRDVVVSFVTTHTQQTVGASDASMVLLSAVNTWLAQR